MRLRPTSLRARVALLTSAAFIGLGTVTVLGLYTVVARLLVAELSVTTFSTSDGQGPPDVRCERTGEEDFVCVAEPRPTVPDDVLASEDGEAALTGDLLMTSHQVLVSNVLDGLRGWTVAVLLLLAASAAGLAWWIARSSLRSVEDLTTTVRGIGHEQLDQRLDSTRHGDEVDVLAHAFNGMLDRLQGAFEAQRQFLGNAAHELRTPLAVARTALDVPLSQGRVPDDLGPALGRAVSAHRRAAEVLDALLVLATTLGAREDRDARLDHVDLAAVAARTVEAVQEAVPHSTVRVRCDLAPAVLLADPTLLELACRNLVDNAVRHNRPDGEVRVSTSANQDQRTVGLAVMNDGAVIDPDDVARLVEPLHRGGAARESPEDRGGVASSTPDHGLAPGLGLGLSLVAAVVDHHGGRLSLRARAGGGLEVEVELPQAVV